VTETSKPKLTPCLTADCGKDATHGYGGYCRDCHERITYCTTQLPVGQAILEAEEEAKLATVDDEDFDPYEFLGYEKEADEQREQAKQREARRKRDAKRMRGFEAFQATALKMWIISPPSLDPQPSG